MSDVLMAIVCGYLFGALGVTMAFVAIEFFIVLPISVFRGVKNDKDDTIDRFFEIPHLMPILLWGWAILGTIIAICQLVGINWIGFIFG